MQQPVLEDLLDSVLKPAVNQVYAALGSGLTEAIYRNALALHFASRGILTTCEVLVPVTYRGSVVGAIRSDIVLRLSEECQCVLELKVVSKLTDSHRDQCRAYLRRMPKQSFAFLVNFGVSETSNPEVEQVNFV